MKSLNLLKKLKKKEKGQIFDMILKPDMKRGINWLLSDRTCLPEYVLKTPLSFLASILKKGICFNNSPVFLIKAMNKHHTGAIC